LKPARIVLYSLSLALVIAMAWTSAALSQSHRITIAQATSNQMDNGDQNSTGSTDMTGSQPATSGSADNGNAPASSTTPSTVNPPASGTTPSTANPPASTGTPSTSGQPATGGTAMTGDQSACPTPASGATATPSTTGKGVQPSGTTVSPQLQPSAGTMHRARNRSYCAPASTGRARRYYTRPAGVGMGKQLPKTGGDLLPIFSLGSGLVAAGLAIINRKRGF